MDSETPTVSSAGEDPRYLQEQIITYIGNKRALLPMIGCGVEAVRKALGKSRLRIADLFSGTGVVARYFKAHADWLVANDLETYSRVSNECYLANASALANRLAELERMVAERWAPGFITELYAPQDDTAIQPGERVFYTRRNAIYLDTARQALQSLPEAERGYFLAPLIARASVHANTSGVFKGFYKGREGVGEFGGAGRNALGRILGDVRLELPIFSRFESEVVVTQADANTLVRTMPEVDLAYIDPPYNQHPYGSNYFMLNLVAEYRRPTEVSRVSGIPAGWNRSPYNRRREVEDALFALVEACPAKFLLVSYNSEGFIGPERFRSRLGSFGELTVLETRYNAFRGSRNLRNRALLVTEFLFLLRKH
jgi:adenine-specific DNA-methyltransferase